MRNLYDILGVSRSATQDEIQKAYRNLARELHPDRNPGNKRSEDQLKEASAAYSILKDPEKRGKYNLMGEASMRSEEHTSELQSHSDLVCRLLLEKKSECEPHTHVIATHRA